MQYGLISSKTPVLQHPGSMDIYTLAPAQNLLAAPSGHSYT